MTSFPALGISPIAVGLLIAFGVVALALALRLAGASRWVVGSLGAAAVVVGGFAWTHRGGSPEGSRVITSYGVALALAVGGASVWAHVRAQREGFSERAVSGVLVWTWLGALLVAKTVDTLARGVTDGAGLSGFGALAGGAVGVLVACRRAHLPLARIADCLAAPLAGAAVLINLGCYLHGCHVGRQLSTQAPGFLQQLGTFPRWSSVELGFGPPALSAQVEAGRLPLTAAQSLPAHPLNLYGALFAVGALLMLIVLHRRGRPLPGREALWVIGWVAGGRALLEFSFGGV